MARRLTTPQSLLSPLPAQAVSSRPDPKPLLLAAKRGEEEAWTILSAYNLLDVTQADRNLESMAGDPYQRRQLAEILPILMEAISRTADPDQALNHWERLLANVARTSFLEYLRSSPRMQELLSIIFGNSDALALTLIRDPTLVYWLAEEGIQSKPPRRRGIEDELRKTICHLTSKQLKLEVLRRFRRREMLRIGVRDLLRLSAVPETTASLSDLACLLIHAAYEIVDTDLRRRYGVPMHKNRHGRWVETGFAVVGMGKLGGHELNYSSDVDLIYVYESHQGETRPLAGKKVGKPAAVGISNEEYFEILARELSKALVESTREGYIFRVDLRLRAEGTIGQLARSLDDYRRYYFARGQAWERLALLKAWPVAGSLDVGKAFLKMVKPFIFGKAKEKIDFPAALALIHEVRAVKELIDTKMADRRHERRNVKLGIGGIREIEFLVQTIQVFAGKRVPGMVHRSTIGALDRCVQYRLMSLKQGDELRAAYVFLRDIEHKLQMVHDLQTHALPDQEHELEGVAVRMGYNGSNRSVARTRLQADHVAHTAVVRELFRSFFECPTNSRLLKAVLRARGKKRLQKM